MKCHCPHHADGCSEKVIGQLKVNISKIDVTANSKSLKNWFDSSHCVPLFLMRMFLIFRYFVYLYVQKWGKKRRLKSYNGPLR